MKKITREMFSAFYNNENFKKQNTEVKATEKETAIYLFGHKIASKIHGLGVFITNCGYATNTTKERLNAISGVNINQKKGVWYLNGVEWSGELIKI